MTMQSVRLFFDLGDKNTFNNINYLFGWDRDNKPKEWPTWLTAPVHYQEKDRIRCNHHDWIYFPEHAAYHCKDCGMICYNSL